MVFITFESSDITSLSWVIKSCSPLRILSSVIISVGSIIEFLKLAFNADDTLDALLNLFDYAYLENSRISLLSVVSVLSKTVFSNSFLSSSVRFGLVGSNRGSGNNSLFS